MFFFPKVGCQVFCAVSRAVLRSCSAKKCTISIVICKVFPPAPLSEHLFDDFLASSLEELSGILQSVQCRSLIIFNNKLQFMANVMELFPVFNRKEKWGEEKL